ncbi:MAG TPA: glycosyltransferase family 4 protein [Candidatus Krumholzibacteria bacterium]|nr:glycosyltransferase family 4 protein [Candidatus Krumholzibacteria bacterium]
MIARVSLLVPGLCRGGMTRAYMLAGALRTIGVRAEIVGALPEGERVYPDPPKGLVLHSFPERSCAERVLDVQDRAQGDALYAVKVRASTFGVALLIRRGRPLIVDADDWEPSFPGRAPRGSWPRRSRRRVRAFANPDHPRYSRWMESLLPRADAVTANTRFLAERYGAAYVPSGKDTALFDPARHDADEARRALGLEGFRVVMFPGTVREHKGVDDVAAALDILGWDDARLVIVGGREAGDHLAREIAARHPRRVVRLGHFGANEMPGVVAAAHVVVAPQRDTPAAHAQFPMKLTDAMAMAKPIVTTRVGDIPEMLDGAAWLVNPSSPREIADALAAVFADPAEAARRGALARQRCIERASLASIGQVLRGVLTAAERPRSTRG